MNKGKRFRWIPARRLLGAALALLMVFSLVFVQAEGVVGYYVSPSSTSVNYYSYNGSSLSSLGLLNSRSAYLVTDSKTIMGVLYYEITVGSTSCYVKASNVTVTSTDAIEQAAGSGVPATPVQQSQQGGISATPIGTVMVTPAGTTNMRSAAHMVSNNIIAKIPQNTVLPLYGTEVPPSGHHVWYYCYYEAAGQYGYILDDCIKVISLTEGATIDQVPTVQTGGNAADPVTGNSAAIGQVRITPTGKTNIRKNPKTDVKNVTAQVDQGATLPYYAVSVVNGETWYYVYVQSANTFGYVLGSCVEVVSSAGVTPTSIPQSFVNTVQGYIRFTAGGVNLRKSASTGAKVLGRFEKDETVAYYSVTTSGSRNWYQVMKNGVVGYVLGDFCVVVSQTGSTPTPQPGIVASSSYLMTTMDKVYVRKSASTTGGIYGQVASAGTVFAISGASVVNGAVTWYPIAYNGNVGYIHGGFVTLLSPEQAAAYLQGKPIPSATPAPTAGPTPIDYIQVNTDKVWIRKAPSTAAGTKGQAMSGAIFHFTGTTISGGTQWYKIDYNGETCYIMARFCRVMNSGESTGGSAGGATPTPIPSSEASNMAVTTIAKVIVRAEGRSGGKQIALLYRSGQLCTLLGNTNAANGYTWYNVTVNGLTGWIRGDLLRILTKAEAAAYVSGGGSGGGSGGSGSGGGSSVGGVTLYRPELIDWNTGGIQTIFAKGDTAIVTDVKSGISFQVRRWSGGDHADVEPLTKADTAAMCRIYGVSTAQQINDKNLYQRHPVLVTLKGHSYAASMYGVPHNYPDGDTIPDNNFNGQFCLHFVNSRIHKTNKVDPDHQKAIMYAYEHAAELLGIK